MIVNNCVVDIVIIKKLLKSKGKKRAEYIRSEDIDDIKEEVIEAETIRQFGIEIMKIEIEDEMRNIILEAQKRQIMVNA